MWHFITDDLKLRDGTLIKNGCITSIEGAPIPEKSRYNKTEIKKTTNTEKEKQ